VTSVIHVSQRGALPDDRYVYIGRPSKWGNPFTVESRGREQAIRLYIDWLEQQPALVAAIVPELRGKTLGCWCAPKACHGDVLARLAEGCTFAELRAHPFAVGHAFAAY
jgi:hypothetical protein